MPEAVNLGSGRGAGWLNDSNTEIKNLLANTNTVGAFAMFDSDTNAAYTVPVGRKLTILSISYHGTSSGLFYIQGYSGGVYVNTKVQMLSTEGLLSIDTALEFTAGQQVYTQHVGNTYCNAVGVESTV